MRVTVQYSLCCQVVLGDLLQARGELGTFRNLLQLRAASLKVVRDPNIETVWINKCLAQKRARQRENCLL